MDKSYQAELQHWLSLIEQNHPSEIEMGLDRILTVYAKLKRRRLAKQVVMVAGTNGKGSTIAVLERLLLSQGLSVGVYSSPHINTYNERVRINGELIDDKRLVEGFQAVEQARKNTPLTYFEFGTLGALTTLEQEQLDIVLLEVGLGGRLDAVNIVDADLSIITSVDIDHVEWLGDNRESIGFEKAGIFRQGKPAIYGGDNPPGSVIQQAKAQNIALNVFGQQFGIKDQGDITSEHYNWLYQEDGVSNSERKRGFVLAQSGIEKSLLMPFSLLPESNVLTAIQAMECLGYSVSESTIVEVLDKVAVKGRLEVHSTQPLVLLDVGHNPHAARFLSRRLSEIKHHRPVYAVFSVLSDKDVKGIIKALEGQISCWHVSELAFPRAMKLAHIESALRHEQQSYLAYDSLTEAFDTAIQQAEENDGIVMCFGSFHVLSNIH